MPHLRYSPVFWRCEDSEWAWYCEIKMVQINCLSEKQKQWHDIESHFELYARDKILLTVLIQKKVGGTAGSKSTKSL